MIKANCYMQLHDAVLSNDGEGGAQPPRLGGDGGAAAPPPVDDGPVDASPAASAVASGVHGRGTEVFLEWFSKLVMRNEPTLGHADYPGVAFVGRDTVHDLYEVFRVENTPGGPHFQAWLDLLQRHGEESGCLALENEELDDVVPLQVLVEFAAGAMEGYRSINVHVGTK